MKYILIIIPLLLGVSCNSAKKNIDDRDSATAISICPEDGVCSFKIKKNVTFEALRDDFNTLYPKVTEGENILLEFQYERNKIPNVADGGYIEQVFVELNPSAISQNLKDNALQDVKVLFARLCFCRGQTGYYKISKGNLQIENIGEHKYTFKLQFTCDEVPQVITHINETFTIE